MNRDESIVAMRQAGATYAAIAKNYGISPNRVMQIVAKEARRVKVKAERAQEEARWRVEIQAMSEAERGAIQIDTIPPFVLSVRSFIALEYMGLETVAQVANASNDELLACLNFGKKSLQEVRDLVRSLIGDQLPKDRGLAV